MHSFVRGGASKLEWCPGWQKRGKRLGKLLPYAFFGPYEGNEIGELLRIGSA